MNTPRVSVALCTRNGAIFVAAQIDSVLRQSELPSQIVLSDDASTDETVAIITGAVADFRSANPSAEVELVTLRNTPPLGVSKNFEQAILASTGDLIALCDQDDVWMDDRISIMTAEFVARPDLALLHSDAILIDADGVATGATLFEALDLSGPSQRAIHLGGAFDELLRRNLVTGATTMFRRSLLPAAVPFPRAWLHDEWLAIVAATIAEVDLLPRPLTLYRQHGANEVGVAPLSMVGKLRRMLEPGANRNELLLLRAIELRARIDGLTSDKVRIHAVGNKLEHERLRSSLSRVRLLRVRPIILELRTGRYSAFGRGPTDALRDLLQPLGTSR